LSGFGKNHFFEKIERNHSDNVIISVNHRYSNDKKQQSLRRKRRRTYELSSWNQRKPGRIWYMGGKIWL